MIYVYICIYIYMYVCVHLHPSHTDIFSPLGVSGHRLTRRHTTQLVDRRPRLPARQARLAEAVPGLPRHHHPDRHPLAAGRGRHGAAALHLGPHRGQGLRPDAHEAAPAAGRPADRRRLPRRLHDPRRRGREHAGQPRRLPVRPAPHDRPADRHVARLAQDPLAHRHRRHADPVRRRRLRPQDERRLRHLRLHLRDGPHPAGLRPGGPRVPDGRRGAHPHLVPHLRHPGHHLLHLPRPAALPLRLPAVVHPKVRRLLLLVPPRLGRRGRRGHRHPLHRPGRVGHADQALRALPHAVRDPPGHDLRLRHHRRVGARGLHQPRPRRPGARLVVRHVHSRQHRRLEAAVPGDRGEPDQGQHHGARRRRRRQGVQRHPRLCQRRLVRPQGGRHDPGHPPLHHLLRRPHQRHPGMGRQVSRHPRPAPDPPAHPGLHPLPGGLVSRGPQQGPARRRRAHRHEDHHQRVCRLQVALQQRRALRVHVCAIQAHRHVRLLRFRQHRVSRHADWCPLPDRPWPCWRRLACGTVGLVCRRSVDPDIGQRCWYAVHWVVAPG
ncbi:hypothetical protein CTA2_364 [Colletotrichum tanaceti]|nr:hypothetical protein CTA2_364 [Colletotrichum tanaceti]